MKNQNHGTAFTLGQFAELVVAVVRALPKALTGFNPKEIIAAVQQGEKLEQVLSKVFYDLLYSSCYPSREEVYPTVVNYRLTVEEIIATGGKYFYVDPNINSTNFPHDRKPRIEQVDIKPINFGCCIGTDEAIKKIKKMGYRLATVAETLTFAAKYPEVHRNLQSIYCLDPVWPNPRDKYLYVLHLYNKPLGGEHLSLSLTRCDIPQFLPCWIWEMDYILAVKVK